MQHLIDQLPDVLPSQYLGLNFLEPFAISPLSSNQKVKTKTTTPSPQKSARSPHQSPNVSSPSTPDSPSSLYCPLCKKKFTNDKTYQLHEQSSKHKELSKKAKTVKVTNSAASSPSQSSSNQEKDGDISKAINAIQFAIKQKESQPNKSMKLCLTAGKLLASSGRIKHAATAHYLVLQISLSINADKELNVTQKILHHKMWLILGRLFFPFNKMTSKECFTNSVRSFIPEEILESVKNIIYTSNLSAFLVECQKVYEMNIQPLLQEFSSKKKAAASSGSEESDSSTNSDENRDDSSMVPSLLSCLNEVAGVVSETTPEPLSIVLYLLHSVVALSSSMYKEATSSYEAAGKILTALNLGWWNVDCLIEIYNIETKHVPTMIPERKQQLMFNALSESLDLDDTKRCTKILSIVESSDNLRSHEPLQFLRTLFLVYKSVDYDMLEEILFKYEALLSREPKLKTIYKSIRNKLLS